MVGWRYVSRGCGVQSVMIGGTSETLLLFAGSWDMMEVSCPLATHLYSSCTDDSSLTPSYTAPVSLQNHIVLSNDSLFYHLDNFDCIGNETALFECKYGEVGVHNCYVRRQEAGVMCNSKIQLLNFCSLIYSYMIIATFIPECNETDVRLVDGTTEYDGRVEICLHGLWGSVYGYKWDDRDAKVVCLQLGYNGCKFKITILYQSA